MMRLQRSHLEALVAVADAGSIMAAAQRLHLSSSAVSKSVAHAERVLGAPLFERTADGMVRLPITDAILSSALLAIQTFESIESRVPHEDSNSEEADQLRVLCASSLVPNPVSDFVRTFLQAEHRPRLALDSLREPDLSLIIDRVLSGHYDVGITETPRESRPGLVVREITPEEPWAVLPPGRGGVAVGEITTDHLVECGLVVGPHWETSDVYRRLVALDSRISGAVRARSMHRDTFLSLTLAGYGAAFMANAPLQHLVEAGCAVGRVQGLRPRRLCVVYRDQPRSSLIEQFATICEGNVAAESRLPLLPL